MFLPLSNEQIRSLGAENTVNEILQQPRLWQETFKIIQNQKEELMSFFKNLSQNHEHVRFVFTGAGTSAFVGETVVPYLEKMNENRLWRLDAIATTDLVSSPTYFFKEDIPTVLVSYARSGNSPESVAAVELGESLVKDFYQLVITCNENGQLANKAIADPNSLLLLMPHESHDQGFAMTSSFSCMLLASLLAFQYEKLDGLKPVIHSLADLTETFLGSLSSSLEDIFRFDFNRIIYLGSGTLGSIARESALKVLELTSGQTISMYETPLGFRHGPKSIMDNQSLIVLFMSQDPYTRKYDLDLLGEVYHADLESKVVVIDAREDDLVKEHCDWLLTIGSGEKEWEDIYLGLVYVTFAQALSVKKSLELGIRVDNPSVNGLLNRVVQGVTIYPITK
jgi:tagatose-6-phosphate ketose/aldose isomerase